MKGKYLAGEIEYQEYRMFLTQTGHAEAELKTVDRILKRADDLCHNGKNKSGTFWLVPETAISRILGRDMNVFLLFAILLIFSRIYSVDYAAKSSEDRFASILRTTRRGRRESFYAKAAAALLVSLAIAAAFVTIDLCIGVTACGTGRFFDILSAPVSSIEGYEAFGSMTVGVYLLSVVLLRFAACIIIAYLTCAASFAVKKLPPTLFLVATATLLPYTLVYMGVGVLRYVDITAMLSGGKLLTRSAEMGLFGTAFGFACILLGGWLAVAVAATIAVRHKTGK